MDAAVNQSHNGVQNAHCHELKATSSQPGAGSTVGSSGDVALTARSPFFSSLGEMNTTRSRSVNSDQVQSLPPQLNPSDHYSPVPHARLHVGQRGGDNDSMLSRGVYSQQPGSHKSSGSSSSSLSYSGCGSWNGAPVDPATNPSSAWPAYSLQLSGCNMGHPVISGADNKLVGGSGYALDGNHPAGSGVQGQGYYYPQQSQYQTHYSGVSPVYNGGANWRPNDTVLHPGVQYQPQHVQALPQHLTQTQPPGYGAHMSLPYGHTQVPASGHSLNHHHSGGQGAAMGGVADNYYAQPSHGYFEYASPSYSQQRGSNPTYAQSSYHPHHPPSSFSSNSLGSSVASDPKPSNYNVSNYHFEYGHSPSNVPYAPLPSHASTSGNSSSLPSYMPESTSIPYHPLSAYTSVSSSPSLSNAPQNAYAHESNPQVFAQPDLPQGQPMYGQHKLLQAQFASALAVTAAQTRATASSLLETEDEHNHPVSLASSREKHRFDESDKELLLESLEKMRIKSTEDLYPGNPIEYPAPGTKLHCSQMSASPYPHDDDNESTCTSFLSGDLSAEHFEDKTHILPDSSIEILGHPQDSEVALNGRIELKCKARLLNSKVEEPDYLWYKDGEPLIGEISSECVLEGVGEGDKGKYFCLVSHPNGLSSEQTRPALVTLKCGNDSRAPRLTQQPEAYVEAVKGEPLVLTIEAEGEGPMSYKWFKGAQELKYCSGNVLSIPSASALDNGQYCCTVSNTYGSVLSDVVLVKVVLECTVLPPITQYSGHRRRYSSNPDDEIPSDSLLRQFARLVAQQTKNWARLILYLGLLTADAANSQHYQASKEEQAYHLLREWRERKKGTVYALRTILTQAGIRLNDPTPKVAAHSPTPSSSQSSSLSISSQPRDVFVVYGQEARLEVKPERTEHSTKFQWYKNGHRLSGKTEKQLIIASTVDSDEGSYHCQISTSEGSVVSHAATIKVVSVAPRSQRFEHKPDSTKGYRQQLHDTIGMYMYGLTGRGVDSDDDGDDDTSVRSHPLSIRQAVLSPTTTPPTAPKDTLQITEHPQSQIVAMGSSVTLSCRAVGCNDVNYTWYMNGLSLPEDTTPDYKIASMTEEDEGMYSCEVSSVTLSLMSHMATISLAK